MIASLILLSWIYSATVKARGAYLVSYVDQAEIDKRNKWIEQARDTREFRPRWVVSIEEDELDFLQQRIGRDGDSIVKAKIAEGAGTVIIKRWQPREIILEVDAPDGATLNASQFYYPGWTARLMDDASAPLAVKPSVPGGLLTFSVPGGRHQVLLRLEPRWPERAGQIMSAISAIVTLLLIVWLYARRSASEQTPTRDKR